jgi:hypothetical protein
MFQAIDRDTGRVLTASEAVEAEDNPLVFKWVLWVETSQMEVAA